MNAIVPITLQVKLHVMVTLKTLNHQIITILTAGGGGGKAFE